MIITRDDAIGYKARTGVGYYYRFTCRTAYGWRATAAQVRKEVVGPWPLQPSRANVVNSLGTKVFVEIVDRAWINTRSPLLVRRSLRWFNVSTIFRDTNESATWTIVSVDDWRRRRYENVTNERPVALIVNYTIARRLFLIYRRFFASRRCFDVFTFGAWRDGEEIAVEPLIFLMPAIFLVRVSRWNREISTRIGQLDALLLIHDRSLIVRDWWAPEIRSHDTYDGETNGWISFDALPLNAGYVFPFVARHSRTECDSRETNHDEYRHPGASDSRLSYRGRYGNFAWYVNRPKTVKR